LRART